MGEFNVLVIDDEADFVTTLLKRLRRKGVECDGAGSGRAAMSVLTDRSFDVVLLDVRLPDMDGNEVLRHIRRMRPAAQVVMLSGYASAEAGRKGLGGGACDYLLKPVEFESLYDKLRAAFDRRVKPA